MSAYLSIDIDHAKFTEALIPSKLQDLRNPDIPGSLTNLALEDFGLSVDLYYVQDGKIYVHRGVCSLFSIPFPQSKLRGFEVRADASDAEIKQAQDECNRLLECLRNIDAMIQMQACIVSELKERYMDSDNDIQLLKCLLDEKEELKNLKLIREVIDVETQLACAKAISIS